jgi:hypothetical protein
VSADHAVARQTSADALFVLAKNDRERVLEAAAEE